MIDAGGGRGKGVGADGGGERGGRRRAADDAVISTRVGEWRARGGARRFNRLPEKVHCLGKKRE